LIDIEFIILFQMQKINKKNYETLNIVCCSYIVWFCYLYLISCVGFYLI